MEKRINELQERLEKLENRSFMINMIDHWTAENYRESYSIDREIDAVKKELDRLWEAQLRDLMSDT